uniref:UDP-glucuronosyltransferase 1-9 n=1 Tax=Lygus hesperus TaxID=30085 RepID=A0A0A9XDI6_LYGHE
MNKTNLVLVLLVVVLRSTAESARILVFFCQTAPSHHIVFHPVIRELAIRGHEVDYYTHVPLPDPPKNLNQFVFQKLDESMKALENMSMVEWGQAPVIVSEVFMRSAGSELPGLDCQNFPEFVELLSSDKKYDMVIGEFFFFQEHFSYLIHRFDALGVAFSSNPDFSWLNEMSGLPDNPAYMSHFFTDFSDKLTFYERVKNTLLSAATKAIDAYYLKTKQQSVADERIRYKGWESRRPVTQQAADLALILTNSHHSLGYPFPTAPLSKGSWGRTLQKIQNHFQRKSKISWTAPNTASCTSAGARCSASVS